MAGASEKKRAIRNIETLFSVHKLSLIVNAVCILCLFLLKRPSFGKKWYFIYSVPAWGCQYVVERTGRPTYEIDGEGRRVLVRAGEDLQQPGLTEYMFDVIYLTLGIDVLMCVFGSMKVYYLLLLIPGYAAWRLRGVASMVLGMVLPRRGATAGAMEGVHDGGNDGKSKRQLKMEKRAAKGQQVRYR